MPIYEYRCEDCGRRSTFLVLKVEDFRPVCKHCGGKNLSKLISRVSFLRSDEDRLERLADPSRLGDIDERDPRSMARWMKSMGRELGEDMGEDFDQMVEEAMEEEGGAAQEDLL
ncbi:MAG: zinc ribbon domain-containing protein [Deltaproteobacteria bacterium]|nr:zinc ribbon domain-containing protein [Deltaproteobacteria bacterium]